MNEAISRQETALIQWECQQLLNRVTMLLDERNWQALANHYTEGAELFRPSEPDLAIIGRENILQSFLERAPMETCHIIGNSVFDVISETKVMAKSRVWLVAGEQADKLPVASNGKLLIGSFIDTLVLEQDAWLIASRKGTIEIKSG